MSLLDLSQVEETGGGFDLLPQGKYLVQVAEAEVKETKAGTGEYINVQFEVLQPAEYEGRKLWELFNIKNPSARAVEIGLGQLKHFLRVAGHPDPAKLGSVDDLVGLKALARVKVKSDATYGESNVVSAFDEAEKFVVANVPVDDTPF